MKKAVKSPVLLLFGVAYLVCSCASVDLYFKKRQIKPLAKEIVGEVRGGTTSEGSESSKIPGVDALKPGMKQRHVQFRHYYEAGLLTEGDDGLLRVEDVRRMGLTERRNFARQVHAENDARKELYRLVAEHLGLKSGDAEEVCRKFGEQWREAGR